jgi:hypothetical protein
MADTAQKEKLKDLKWRLEQIKEPLECYFEKWHSSRPCRGHRHAALRWGFDDGDFEVIFVE